MENIYKKILCLTNKMPVAIIRLTTKEVMHIERDANGIGADAVCDHNRGSGSGPAFHEDQ